jgi:S-DNA-T family DNA segregation ATPase FtsK/SpoIIIE
LLFFVVFSTIHRQTKPKTKSHNVEIVEELEENSKLLAGIEKGQVAKPKNFRLPKIDFLQKAPKVKKKINEDEIDRKIEDLLTKLAQFKVDGDVIRTYSGPLVTTFEFKPAPNVKVSKILGLQDDLAMALAAKTIRIQAPIPGRDVVGIEIPNADIDTIYLREILESDVFKESSSPLTVALGKDIVGKAFVTDLKKLPHLLIAGTTGSGKSVGVNAMILSLLYRNDPDQLKLMLIDPKMLEFSMYEDIPHLITPVITEPAKAIAALANMVGEMERRYKLMAESRTKNIENYNDKVKREASAEPFPYIVVVIDELADLMMNGGKEVELSIARLAQKSRACGIHLVVATQRPSVDVVTGLIKANLPSRLSYRVGQRIDSKVILDQMGAESLLGRGDGLFTPPGATGLVRIHAPWSTEEEIDTVVEFLKAQRVPEYDESYLVAGGSEEADNLAGGEIELDPLFEQAKQVVMTDKKTSISYLQRKLQIGYNRSANLIEQLEQMGVLSAPNAKGQREIL